MDTTPSTRSESSGKKLHRAMRMIAMFLTVILLSIACAAGLEVVFLLAQTRAAVANMEASIEDMAWNASATFAFANKTLETQQGYYRDSASHIKALTKAAAIDAVHLGRLIDSTDERIGMLTSEAVQTITSLRVLPEQVANDTKQLVLDTHNLLQAATNATTSIQALASDDNIAASLTSIKRSSENIETTTAAASQSMGYIRDMLSPAKKSFWKRLLELMIPRPTLRVP